MIAEEVGHILGLGVLEVGKRLKAEGFDLARTQEWSDRIGARFVKEGIEINVIFSKSENKALIVEGRKA